MFVAFSVGKWIQETCNELYGLIAERTQQPNYCNKINFCTDGNEQNENALLKFFNKDCINYGQVIKDKEKQIVFGIHKRKTIWNLLSTYQAYHNLIKTKQGETPCMKEGLTHFAWSWGKLLNARISSRK